MPNHVRQGVAAGISDDGGQLSHVSWLGWPGGHREPAGLIVVWQMCYPVQHVLDAAASMASSATLRGILLRAVSGCCYNSGGLRNRRWANAITKHGSKGEWQTSVQTLPLNERTSPLVEPCNKIGHFVTFSGVTAARNAMVAGTIMVLAVVSSVASTAFTHGGTSGE